MEKINSSQRSYLKSQAHHLNPVVLIGKNGLNDGAIDLINKALDKRELIKIKFRDFKDNKRSLSEEITMKTDSILVSIIGHTLIIFKENLNSEKRHLKLP